MQFTVTFRHMEPSETLKEYSYDKLLRLEKYLDAVIDAEMVMSVEKFRHKAEVLIVSDGLKIKAEEETDDMYSSIDMVVDKLEKQIKRHRDKQKDHKGNSGKRLPHRDDEFPPVINDEPERPVFDRHLTITPEKMTVDQAGAQLASSNSPQVIFINSDDGRLSIIKLNHGGIVELLTINQ